MTSAAGFTVLAIPDDVLDSVRRTTAGVPGSPVERRIADGGEPLRCCLRDARPREELLLFGYRPPLPAESPYLEQGAVFVHAHPCGGPVASDYPAEWRGRPQVLRAYDADGHIHPASCLHDGRHPVRALEEVLGADGVVEVHSRNVVYGCYMFSARPAT
jgi:hypothetical protein